MAEVEWPFKDEKGSASYPSTWLSAAFAVAVCFPEITIRWIVSSNPCRGLNMTTKFIAKVATPLQNGRDPFLENGVIVSSTEALVTTEPEGYTIGSVNWGWITCASKMMIEGGRATVRLSQWHQVEPHSIGLAWNYTVRPHPKPSPSNQLIDCFYCQVQTLHRTAIYGNCADLQQPLNPNGGCPLPSKVTDCVMTECEIGARNRITLCL